MDNLNTHSTASLYQAFPPAEAHRLAEMLEIHYTHSLEEQKQKAASMFNRLSPLFVPANHS